MPRDRRQIGACPHCDGGIVVCTYNRFDGPAERIDSWEHRCENCGRRETQAFRSTDDPPAVEPEVCPYCARRGGA